MCVTGAQGFVLLIQCRADFSQMVARRLSCHMEAESQPGSVCVLCVLLCVMCVLCVCVLHQPQ